MATTKPVTKVRWANTTSANITDPISGLKDVGYLTNDIPTAHNFNWVFNRVMLWQDYLDGLEDAILTWTQLVTMSARLIVTGTVSGANGTNAITATGGTGTTGNAGSGITPTGGAASGTNGNGGYGVDAIGGASAGSNGFGGQGVKGRGGAAGSGTGGIGVWGIGGVSGAAATQSGAGVDAIGGDAGTVTGTGGPGIFAIGGNGDVVAQPSIGGPGGDFTGGASAAAGATGGRGLTLLAGDAKGNTGIGGDGLVATAGKFYPSTNTQNGTAGSGVRGTGGNTRTNGTTSVAGYGGIFKSGNVRNAADSGFTKGTIRSALYVAPGRKELPSSVFHTLGTGILVADESAGDNNGGPQDGCIGIDCSPDLATIRLQANPVGWTPLTYDLRNILTAMTIPAVKCQLNLTNATPSFLKNQRQNVFAVSYPSATRLRISFGSSSIGAASFVGAATQGEYTYFFQMSGGYEVNVVNTEPGYIEVEILDISNATQTINAGALAGFPLNFFCMGNWA